jgi:hypothetical protein
MGAMRRLPSSNGAASDAAPVPQQQVVYSSLDNISSRVEIYKGRCAMLAFQPTNLPWFCLELCWLSIAKAAAGSSSHPSEDRTSSD